MERSKKKLKVSLLAIFCVMCVLFYRNVVYLEYISMFYEPYQHRPYYCRVNCSSGTPCEYTDEVDFRIMVMTYKRGYSLRNVLNSLLKLDTLNDRVSVEIWIDRSKDGEIDEETVQYARSFVHKFSAVTANGRACIQKQNNNSNIGGQWLFTWRPKEGTNELGLILEDDVVVSPLAYKWIKLLHTKYGHESNIAGYTLQMENVKFFSKVHNKKGVMTGPPHQQVFLYPVIGSWGYAPHPRSWRRFQDWYMQMRPDLNVKTDRIEPNVPGIHPTDWWYSFLRNGRQENMWTMWHIKFSYEHKLFTMYSNLHLYTRQTNVLLSNNRRERGLHFGPNFIHIPTNHFHLLLRTWHKTFENLPGYEELAHYNYNGSPCTKTCCFNASCLTGIE